MNASQFMDKQIMDLTSSPSTHSLSSSPPPPPPPPPAHSQSANDILDLFDPPHDSIDHHHHHHPHDHRYQQSQHTHKSNTSYNGGKPEEILPNYDFQPLRSLDSTPTRAWNSADSKPTAKNYGAVDFVEVGKQSSGGGGADLLSEIDRVMKKHADDLLHVLDEVSARLTQLESRTRHLESSVDELKVVAGNNHGSSDGKMRQLENILREVQSGVQVLKDKQDIVEAQLQLAKLQVSKADQKQSETQNTGHMDTMQQAASAPPQSHPQLPPATFPQSIPPVHIPPVNVPSPNPPPTIPSAGPVPNQFPENQIPSVPQHEPYYPPPGQTPEPTNPQYQLPATQHSQPPPAAPPHQPYQPVPQPHYSQPPQSPQRQPQVGHHPEETSYVPSQIYPTNQRLPSSQPPSGAPPSQQYYGAPSHLYDPASGRANSGFPTGFVRPSGPGESHPYGGSPSQYGSSPIVKPQQLSTPAMSQGAGGGYPQLPTARILPQALPTASTVGARPGSPGPGNRVPVDDVVDKITNMGFPRDHVRATVRRLTENGQAVDLNTVLDRLMNDGEIQPQRGWFGR